MSGPSSDELYEFEFQRVFRNIQKNLDAGLTIIFGESEELRVKVEEDILRMFHFCEVAIKDYQQLYLSNNYLNYLINERLKRLRELASRMSDRFWVVYVFDFLNKEIRELEDLED